MCRNMCNHVPMQNIDVEEPGDPEEWHMQWSRRFGQAVRAIRKERHMTAAQLSAMTGRLGSQIKRVTITKIENNSRAGQKVDLAEVIILALALGVAPTQLLFPELPDGKAQLWPNALTEHTNTELLLWFSGELSAKDLPGTAELPPADISRIQHSREIQQLRAEVKHLYQILMSTATTRSGWTANEKQRQLDLAAEQLESRIAEALERDWPVIDD